jgi:ATP-binding cassette subfamily B protein RaxB
MLTGIQAVTEYVRAWIIMYLGNTLNLQLSAGLVHHLFGLPLEFFEKRHMGDIVSRFGSLSAIQQKISSDFVEGIVDGIMVIATVTVMFIYNYTLTLVVLAALLLYIIIRMAFYSTFKRQNQENLVASAKENSIFMESVRAILPLKTFGKETQRESIWQNTYVDKLNSAIRMGKLGLLYRLLNHLVFGVENIVVIMLGANAVMHNVFSIGMLLAYLSYRQQFVSKAQGMVDKIIEYRMVSLHLERVADIALAEPEVTQEGVGSTASLRGNVQTEGLAFRYSDNDPYLFKDLNLTIGAGEMVAIAGRSGCGKTTLIKILLRLLTPSEGKVLIDGTDVNKMDVHAYRPRVAAVMQDDILLSGSIAENICFFDPRPDQERMYICAMASAIHEEIASMPMAYQSLVGDMGTSLSGGQKQRILLARALYCRPRILFLDEATSHLDAETERIIHENIARLGITRIIVAHRRESIAIADRVIELGG